MSTVTLKANISRHRQPPRFSSQNIQQFSILNCLGFSALPRESGRMEFSEITGVEKPASPYFV
jgi:hypothetical protein